MRIKWFCFSKLFFTRWLWIFARNQKSFNFGNIAKFDEETVFFVIKKLSSFKQTSLPKLVGGKKATASRSLIFYSSQSNFVLVWSDLQQQLLVRWNPQVHLHRVFSRCFMKWNTDFCSFYVFFFRSQRISYVFPYSISGILIQSM